MDLRTLDKDLSRLGHQETAGLHNSQNLLRLGLVVLFIALSGILGTWLIGAGPETATVAAGLALAAYFAVAIGANDVANSLAPAVGAGAISVGMGLIVVGAAEVAGALLLSHRVSMTLGEGILGTASQLQNGIVLSRVMVAALISAACWVNLATWAGAPVSTTHAIVGGIAGAGIAAFGWSSLNWGLLGLIALGWMIAPILAALIAGGLLGLLSAQIDGAEDRLGAVRRWLGGMMAATAGAMTLYLSLSLSPGPPVFLTAVAALAIAGLAWIAARILFEYASGVEETEAAIFRRLFSPMLILVAALMGFAHGANDASNVTAPLTVILHLALTKQGAWYEMSNAPDAAILVAGCGIAVGAVLFGRRLVVMVGGRITRLNPVRAVCVALATVTTVLAATAMALPVSTTHIAVGGVFGVGFYREWEDRRRARKRKVLPVEERRRRELVRRIHLRRILIAWVITVPVSAVTAGLVMAFLS